MKLFLIFTLFGSFALASTPSGSHPAQPVSKSAASRLPHLLQEVEAKYSQASTLVANFSQINKKSAFNQQTPSLGLIMFKRPDKIRWETYAPDKNMLISNGRRFWFYTPPFDVGENGQYSEKRSSEVQSRLAHALLSGSFSMAKDMRIKQIRPSEFTLTPKPGAAGSVLRATIIVDVAEKLVKKVILDHKGGNRAEITLSKIVLGKDLGNELFEFTPPPNTDRIDQ